LRAHRGQLLHGDGPGSQVHAASFLNQRLMVLDEALLDHAPDLVNIFAHEVYHFVWRRLANADRAGWGQLLADETAPLHPGLSSRLSFEAHQRKPSPRSWKEYICEAFCDSAAALGASNQTMAAHRREWLRKLMARRRLPV
jgi:hypothetical protein